MRLKYALPLALLLLAVPALRGLAQEMVSPTSGLTFASGPIYDPEAKRYFALVKLFDTHNADYEGFPWWAADAQARQQVYKGIHGRLAIVDSFDVHQFLLLKVHPDPSIPAWIGLRYLCNSHRLEWTNGKFFKPGDFEAWDARWNQDVYFCQSSTTSHPVPEQYGPVAYSPLSAGFRWIAKGFNKRYTRYFIEFPSDKPLP